RTPIEESTQQLPTRELLGRSSTDPATPDAGVAGSTEVNMPVDRLPPIPQHGRCMQCNHPSQTAFCEKCCPAPRAIRPPFEQPTDGPRRRGWATRKGRRSSVYHPPQE